METTGITTPAGHKVTIRQSLTFGEKRQLQRATMHSAIFNPQNPEDVRVPATAVYDAQDAAIKLLVTRIERKDGAVIEAPPEAVLEAVLAMDEADGNAIYDAINALTTPTVTPEKKGA